MENYRCGSRLNGEAAFGHDVVRARNRDGNDGNSALEREIERAFLEGQQLAVERALAFDVDGHVNALVDDLLGGVDSVDASLAIAAVDGDERAKAHGASEDGRAKQLLLDQDRSAARDERNGDRWVEIGDVVRHEDVSARGVELVEADGCNVHAGEADAGNGSPGEHAVEEADVAGEEGPGKADERGQGRGDGPEGEHEERAEHVSDCSGAASYEVRAGLLVASARAFPGKRRFLTMPSALFGMTSLVLGLLARCSLVIAHCSLLLSAIEHVGRAVAV